MFGRKNKRQSNQRPTSEICVNDDIQNAANTLLANIRFSSVDKPLKVIAVTSSVPNEGKTTVTVSLAIAIGARGLRCLIVEGDMRRRSLRGVLGLHPNLGIHAVMTEECMPEQAITSTHYDNVDFLDAEYGIPNPDGILSSKRFDAMLGKLRTWYDYVIIDTPPVEAFADAAIIANKVDGTVMVARDNFTEKRELAHALSQLDAAGANMLGVILNDVPRDSGNYYYKYYYDEDGNRKKTKEGSSNGSGKGKRGEKSGKSKKH